MSIDVPESTRREIKFVASESELSNLLHWVRSHPAGFTRPFPDRWNNNIYFDTYDLAACTENLSGTSARNKVRYRWYGDSVQMLPGTLEIKRKRNFFGWKIRFRIEEPPYSAGANWRQIRGNILRQLPEEGRLWLQMSPAPVILNRYLRKYFVSEDGKIRLTIDSRQAVYDQRMRSIPNLTRKTALLPQSLIVEFKFERGNWQLASNCIQKIPIRVSRHSKYMTAVMAVQQI